MELVGSSVANANVLYPAYSQALTPYTFRLTNNLSGLFSWNYPDYRWLYCTDGHWIPGEKNVLIGSIYIVQYLFFLALYIPSLLVISRPAFLKHSCYKMMLVVGLMDIYNGFFVGLWAGIFSIMGANYCDNTMLLTGRGPWLGG